MKITEDQKESRKIAVKARNKAHRARYKEFDAALNDAVSAVEAEKLPPAEKASKVFDALLEEREKAEAEIRQKIAALEDDLKKTRLNFEPRIQAARDEMSRLFDLRNFAKSEAEARVADKFPDMKGSGRWSAAAWKPLDEFLPGEGKA